MSTKTSLQFQNPRGKVQYLFLSVLFMFLMISLRDINTGVDTRSYVNSFLKISLTEVNEGSEPLYVYITYFVRCITENYHIFFMVMSAGYCIAIYKLLRKYLHTSDEVMIGILLLFLFGIYHFSSAAMRQTVALGFGILAFVEADRGNWKKYLLWIVLGMGFHNSAALLLLIYPLRYINLGKYGVLVVVAMYGVSLVIPKDFLMLIQLSQSSTDELRYSQYGSSYESELSLTGFFLQLIPLAIVYIRRDHLQLEERTKNLFLNCAYLGAGFQSLVVVVAEFYRVSFYYAVFDIVLIPLALSTLPKKVQTPAKIAFVLGCLVYLFFIGTDGTLPVPNAKTSNYN